MKNLFIITGFIFILLSCASSKNSSANNKPQSVSKNQIVTYPYAIRMAEARIERFVTTPEEMRDKTWEISKNTWDSVTLINQRELPDGMIEYTLRFSVRQGNRVQSRNQVNTVQGPKIVYPWSFGGVSGPNERLSAYNGQILIDQCKTLYTTDPEYRKIVDIVEKEVVLKLNYDWEARNGRFVRSYQESLRLGVGVCDVYADLVIQVLSREGYTVEKWSSSVGNHAWNHVILPNGKILYIDATWYDNNYENHPTQRSLDGYCPWYITYDKALFEHGLLRTINMHGGWPDARRVR